MLVDDCIFCGKCRKTWNKSEEKICHCLTEDKCKSILEAAEKKADKSLMSSLREGYFITKEPKYHKSFRCSCVKSSETHMPKPTTSQTVHAEIFQIIGSFVCQEVIDMNVILAPSLFELCTEEVLSSSNSQELCSIYSSKKDVVKIMFLSITSWRTKRQIIWKVPA